MKLNIPVSAADVAIARSPAIGEDVVVRFAPEVCVELGQLRCTGASAGTYTSAGGLQIPTGGRDVFVRVAGAKTRGTTGSAMTVTFNVVLDDDSDDTAVATFHIPTWSTFQDNILPIGAAADLIPATVGNVHKKIKSITSIASVANMVAGNRFEIFTSPADATFVEIEGCRGKGGAFNLPEIIQIAAGREAVKWTKLGRGKSNPLKIENVSRGAMEQLARFSGQQGTIRFDLVKDDAVLSQIQLYSGFWPQPMGDIPDTGEVVSTAEGPYEKFAIGYMRVS